MKDNTFNYLNSVLGDVRALLGRVFQLKNLFWLVILALVVYAFRDVSWGEVWDILNRLNVRQVLALLFITFLVFWSIGMQSWVILYVRGFKVSLMRLIAYWMAGFTVSYFIPGPQLGGGFVQIYFLRKNHSIDIDQATGVVIVIKVLADMGSILTLLLGLFLVVQLALIPLQATTVMVLSVILVFGLLAGYLLATYKNHNPVTRLLQWMPEQLKNRDGYRKLVEVVGNAERLVGRYSKEQPAALIYIPFFSMLSWMFVFAQAWLLLQFLDIRMTPLEVVGVVTIAQLATLFPTPAGAGAVETSLVFTFQQLGFSPNEAATYILIFRARDLILGFAGLVVGWLQSLPFMEIVERQESQDQLEIEYESGNPGSED
jgi:uncharacterized protein (TIRG00374 family)